MTSRARSWPRLPRPPPVQGPVEPIEERAHRQPGVADERHGGRHVAADRCGIDVDVQQDRIRREAAVGGPRVEACSDGQDAICVAQHGRALPRAQQAGGADRRRRVGE